MPETKQQKLEMLRTFRAEYRETIDARIEELQTEKREMMQEYDLQISELRNELEQLGFPLKVGVTGNAALAGPRSGTPTHARRRGRSTCTM
jgi:hypothetical protein